MWMHWPSKRLIDQHANLFTIYGLFFKESVGNGLKSFSMLGQQLLSSLFLLSEDL
jgi:hypothetical protein